MDLHAHIEHKETVLFNNLNFHGNGSLILLIHCSFVNYSRKHVL